jgi:hypothetical protein
MRLAKDVKVASRFSIWKGQATGFVVSMGFSDMLSTAREERSTKSHEIVPTKSGPLRVVSWIAFLSRARSQGGTQRPVFRSSILRVNLLL